VAPLGPLRSSRLGHAAPIVFFLALWGLREVSLAIMARNFANDTTILDIRGFILNCVSTAVAKPGVFLIAHVATFGPGFVLLLRYLREIMNVAAKHSAGAALLIIVSLMLAINSESRILAFAYPLLIVFLCIVLEQAGVTRRFTFVFLFVS